MNRAFLLALRESVGADIALSEWAERDPAGLGEYAAGYQFHYADLDDGGGDGALVVFSRGGILSVLAVLETDEQASADLHRYAQVVDARIRAEGRQ